MSLSDEKPEHAINLIKTLLEVVMTSKGRIKIINKRYYHNIYSFCRVHHARPYP